LAVVDVVLEVDVELEPQAARIVATMATAAQPMITLRRYISPPFLRQYDNGASGGGAMAGQKDQIVLDAREPAQT
jgi:hypothetical protein